jgi:hypothetical protein
MALVNFKILSQHSCEGNQVNNKKLRTYIFHPGGNSKQEPDDYK